MTPAPEIKSEKKSVPWLTAVTHAAIDDRVGERLGPDELLLLLVVAEQQDRKLRHDVGFFRGQLAARCGFPATNPRRLRAAREALRKDGWLWCDIPTGGDRIETIYRVTPKPKYEIDSTPFTRDENVSGERVTGDGNVSRPGTDLSHDPVQICPTSISGITNPGITNPNPPLIPQKGELFDSGKAEKRKGKQSKTSEADIEAIYAAYPRKVNREDALKAIGKALKLVPHAELLAAVKEYATAKAGTDRNFIPHCATWMNKKKWTDPRDEWRQSAATPGRGSLIEASSQYDPARKIEQTPGRMR